MKGQRALARLSVRAIKRAPLRSLLIILLIALMVAIGSMVATIDRSSRVTGQDIIDGELGSADLSVSVALRPGGASWGIFGSPDTEFGTGTCSTYSQPDGSSVTTCEGPVTSFPQAVPFPAPFPEPACPPGAECGSESEAEREPTPAEQAVIDAYEEWESTFDPDAVAATLRDLLDADVTVIRESTRFESQARSPFLRQQVSVEMLTDIDLNSPINGDSARIVEGRTPQGPNEIVLPVDEWSNQPLSLGDAVDLGDDTLTLVGRAALAGRHNSFGSWALVTPEAFDTAEFEVTSVRFRIDGIDSADSPMGLNTTLPTIERVIGQPIYAATDQFLASPVGSATWSIIDRDRAGEFGYTSRGADLAVAIATTALSGLVGLQVVLVIAAAFTVGRRRRAREFGQLITVGADARHLRRLALTEGFVLGVLGAVLGIIVGLIFASIGVSQGWWGDGNPFQTGARFSPLDWVGPAVAGVTAAVLSAWWPVRKIADAPLAAGALADVPPARPAAYIPKLGAVLAIGGVVGLGAITLASRNFFYSVGPLVALLLILVTFLGLLITIGSIVSWVGRRADRLPLLARLVVRNSDRHRNRSWLVVGAFILTIGIPIAIGAAIEAYPSSFGGDRASVDESTFSLVTRPPFGGSLIPVGAQEWTADEIAAYELESGTSLETALELGEQIDDFAAAFTARVPEVLADVTSTPVRTLDSTELSQTAPLGAQFRSGGTGVAIATPELLAFYDIDASYINSLGTTTALAIGEGPADSDGQILRWPNQFGTSDPQPYPVRVEYTGEQRRAPGSAIGAIISAELADTIGSPGVVDTVVFRTDAAISREQDNQLRSLADEIWLQTIDPDIAGLANGVYLDSAASFSNQLAPGTYRLIVAAIAAAIAALIALTTSALTAVESERELESLIATGARPSIRRSFLGTQTLYHLGLAALLAVPSALIIYWVVVQIDDFGPRGPVVPWISILLSAVVMPLVVAALVFALFRNGRPAVSRRVT